VTLAPHTALMGAASDRETPLASFVLRVRGQPARLRYELLDVRTGERRRFTRLEKLSAHLRALGLHPDHLGADTSGEQ
jgi:hypothetical protein